MTSPIGGCARRNTQRSAGASAALLMSAADTPQGRHALVGSTANGELRFTIPVDERCHGGCARPGGSQRVLFARRPGRHFYVVDTGSGTLIQRIAAEADYHFYGHGAFSTDGRYLYASENHYPSGQGWIAVYDAQRSYRRINRFHAGGIGPHELRLHPDGETLLVALGGIQTHPDYQRIKLNLATMAPALLLINRHTGQVQQRHTPSDHQLSCRHLDVSPDGIVIVGYQYQGSGWQHPPLLARLDTATRQFQEITLPPEVLAQLHNYTASVAVHPHSSCTAVTAPRGGQTLLLNHRTGELLRTFSIADCAGAMADGDGFLITSGKGLLYRISPQSQAPQLLARHPIHWDNHLTP